jgi:hypothetical protein
MDYATPELVLLGAATALVQGSIPGENDNGSSVTSQPPMGITLGFDE